MKPIAGATPDQVRQSLLSLAAEGRVTLATLSRLLGQPSPYLEAFASGNSWDRLLPSECAFLSDFFMVARGTFGEQEM